jgi:membrane protein DedA with SNARE-associated domain
VSSILDTLTAFIQNLYVVTGLAGIVLAMAIESCCIPLPSEIIMPLAGAMLTTGSQEAVNHLMGIDPAAPLWLNLIFLSLAGSLGSLLGSVIAYSIGSAGGRPLLLKYGKYVLISQHDADRADRFFQRWGAPTAFFSRMLPVVRTYISLPAGITRMRFGIFCLYTFLGSLPWCLLLSFVGYELGRNYSKISGPLHYLDAFVVVLVVVLAALYIWRHIRNDRRARAAHAASVQSTRPLDISRGQPAVQIQQPVNQAAARPPFQNQPVPPASSQQPWGQPPQDQPGQNWR